MLTVSFLTNLCGMKGFSLVLISLKKLFMFVNMRFTNDL